MDDITLKRISVDENDTEQINKKKRKQISQTKHFDIERIKRTTVASTSKTQNCSVGQKQQQNGLKKKNEPKTRRIKQSFSPAA